jgi:ABC-type cobalamin/Fe3+-siderophores transport system ATPase subunit
MRPVVVVGPCAAGKTTLVGGLRALGVEARAVAQEHSAVSRLYRQHARDGTVFVYLTADYRVLRARRPLSGGRPQYQAEWERLSDARAAAHLLVHTDGVPIATVRDRVYAFLASLEDCRSDH